MIKNILQLLENTVELFPNKVAFGDDKREVTYVEFLENSKKIGSCVAGKKVTQKPIIIFIDKTVNCLETMMGVIYSGNFYTILDTKTPAERAKSIIDTLDPIMIITDEKNEKKMSALDIQNVEVLMYEDAVDYKIDEETLKDIRDKQIDTDIIYVLFTSGSTGIPKGTVLTHKAVISYTTWVKDTFDINENTIWGSQTPFYFSMSITDVFSTIITGATLYIIPKMYFSFPVKLIEYMNEKRINSIYWVPSALCIVANLGALKTAEFESLQKILFAGEVMPVKQLNEWIKKLPNAQFANLYGPTETTDICSYYVIDRKFENDESIPMGKHCNNCDLIIVDENGNKILPKKNEESKIGELLVRGSFLASGYYKNPEKTKEAFIQNPINNSYPEIVYKTGDLVKYNKRGELIYISRKDYQIKHMGYRIELGEIERNIYGIDKIVLCACIYDEKEQKIVLFYQGELEIEELAEEANKRLLPYMRPNKYIKVSHMPYNANGKIDRKKLKGEM